MMIRAGDLDRRITIQAATETQTASGFPAKTWADVATVWCRRLDVGARERFEAGQDLAERVAKFTIRWRPGVTTKQRLVEPDGTIWGIDGLAEIGRRVGIEITASIQPDEGL